MKILFYCLLMSPLLSGECKNKNLSVQGYRKYQFFTLYIPLTLTWKDIIYHPHLLFIDLVITVSLFLATQKLPNTVFFRSITIGIS